MAKSEVQRCLDWLFQQQTELECSTFGEGLLGVQEALSRQRSKDKEIQRFRSDMDKVLDRYATDNPESKELVGKYDSLKGVAQKRSSCLEVISQIASLEDLVEGLSTEFDTRAVHLVSLSQAKKHEGATKEQSNESMAKTAQNCITAVRKNWKWVMTTMRCAEVHLKNAAAYQEYFHEVEEAEYWMNTTLSRIHTSFDRTQLNGDKADAQTILMEIRDVLMAYLQWQTKVDSLFDRSKDIVPVPLRLNKVKEPRPVLALTDYKSNEIEFIEGETLTLVDNSNKQRWMVQNSRGQSALVPAIIILIPGPAAEAVDAAIRLRVQLLSLWTTSIKRLGYQMIAFMLIIFRDWSEDESNDPDRQKKIQVLQAMNNGDRDEMIRILKYIEDTLMEHWKDYSDFQELQEKILRLRMILEEAPEGNREDNELQTTVVVQVKLLEQLLTKYKDFWSYWETFKTIVELLRQPKYLLVCDKWDQLRYITTAHFVKFWDTHLELENMSMIEQAAASVSLHETPKEPMPASSEVTISTEKEETTTDEVDSTVAEERHTFVIKGVLDPLDGHEMSLQHAIMLGIVDQARGLYINPRTGKTMSLAAAMNEGQILMEFVSREKIREEKKSFGLITVKTTRETRPYTILGVVDPNTENRLGVAEAMDKGILNTRTGMYKTETGKTISIADAISSGLVDVEYHEDDGRSKPVVETKTYAVNAVVDQKKKSKVSFNEAVRLGILDRNTGDYVNNVTGERVHTQQAIMKGFIKARIVTDPNALDIDPENKIVVQKFSNAKEKLMKTIKTSRAFRN